MMITMNHLSGDTNGEAKKDFLSVTFVRLGLLLSPLPFFFPSMERFYREEMTRRKMDVQYDSICKYFAAVYKAPELMEKDNIQ